MQTEIVASTVVYKLPFTDRRCKHTKIALMHELMRSYKHCNLLSAECGLQIKTLLRKLYLSTAGMTA